MTKSIQRELSTLKLFWDIVVLWKIVKTPDFLLHCLYRKCSIAADFLKVKLFPIHFMAVIYSMKLMDGKILLSILAVLCLTLKCESFRDIIDIWGQKLVAILSAMSPVMSASMDANEWKMRNKFYLMQKLYNQKYWVTKKDRL